MDLIIGGAYQGKRRYAQTHFGIPEESVFTCREDGRIDWSAPCIAGLEEFAFSCVKTGRDPVAIFRSHRENWSRSVLICGDISSGVVPLGAENRAWREASGRLSAYLAGEADTVTRMFCGLAQKLK